ncbi:MAG: hypothetical protein Q9173_001668 [Seirophora scorigena]
MYHEVIQNETLRHSGSEVEVLKLQSAPVPLSTFVPELLPTQEMPMAPMVHYQCGYRSHLSPSTGDGLLIGSGISHEQ